MKSVKNLIKIQEACQLKRNKFEKGHVEYIRLSDCILSLENQITKAQEEDSWSWADISGEDGYVGDGIYAPGSSSDN